MASGDILGITGDPLLGFKVLLVVIAVNTVLGIALALKDRVFNLDILSNFVRNSAPYLLGLGIFAITLEGLGGESKWLDYFLNSLYYGGLTTVVLTYAKGIREKVNDLVHSLTA